MRATPIALLLAAATASAATRVPPATPIGPAIDCVAIARIRETHVHDDRTIDFVTSGPGRVYRNTLPNACQELGLERRFSYATSLPELCSSDVITVLQETPPMRGASCGLGRFQPVRLSR